jgi:hypothetical protein
MIGDKMATQSEIQEYNDLCERACAILQGILSNPMELACFNEKKIVETAVRYARYLGRELEQYKP